MGLHTTPQGDRIQIALYGMRNAGKSSIINALTGQRTAIVSDIKGTTTDPVSKAMEILPVGPCMLIDTPGLDDEGELGKKRIEKTMQVLNKTDIALVVVDITTLLGDSQSSGSVFSQKETEIISLIEEKKIPYIIVLNQADRIGSIEAEKIRSHLAGKNVSVPVVVVSCAEGRGIEELKETLISQMPDTDLKLHIIGDFIDVGDIILLVVPVDSAAPKGRLIMPQQQVIRDILDNQAIAVVTQVPQLAKTLEELPGKVKMVVTDSQAFKEVAAIVPDSLLLTSFSILFARHKGNLQKLAESVKAVARLKDGDRVLIAEGCTHHRQCEDIGTVKIPRWLKQYTGKDLEIETCSGTEFPADLSPYAMVIHCGGCTLHEREMKHRIFQAGEQQVPIVNYGIFIAHVNGILERSVEIFPEIYETVTGHK